MKSFWLNLPVANIQKSKAFFKAIGFKPNPMHEGAEHLASFLIGEKEVVLMLFPEATFTGFTQNGLVNTAKATEVLLNIDAQSKAEVDALAKTVQKAGGTLYVEPSESEGWMYGMGFKDLDGHRWSVLYMDMDKMPKQ
ncbi:VOC family protein [Marixanthomonas spongiae]|uniref:Extradiol dioxygenase n=1 Tax=Marixanthomonas spongiae TaxID=2174845 RepID=A0A2U0I5N3_9FLAO|nr:VOC family protein [Marixanthomonas spongiae]PVW16417.1 extradiol dioxygenase [Marixanthomonas spongiae]